MQAWSILYIGLKTFGCFLAPDSLGSFFLILVQSVLFENHENGYSHGLTENYIRVYVKSDNKYKEFPTILPEGKESE